MSTKQKKSRSFQITAGILLVLVVLIVVLAVFMMRRQPSIEQSVTSMKIPAAPTEPANTRIPSAEPTVPGSSQSGIPAPQTVPENSPGVSGTEPNSAVPQSMNPNAQKSEVSAMNPEKETLSSNSAVSPPSKGASVSDRGEIASPPSADIGMSENKMDGNQEKVKQRQGSAHQLMDVSFQTDQPDGKGVRMIVRTSKAIQHYHQFLLSAPPRFVIDFNGRWIRPSFYSRAAGNEIVKGVRLWKYDDKLRLVCDLQSDRPIRSKVETTPEGLMVKMAFE